MALNTSLRDILQSLQSDIVLTTQLNYLLPILRQKHLVTESEFQQLSSSDHTRESNSEKNCKLIRIITSKGEDAFNLFVESLQEETEHLGHASLAKKLLLEQKQVKDLKLCPPIPLPRRRKVALICPDEKLSEVSACIAIAS